MGGATISISVVCLTKIGVLFVWPLMFLSVENPINVEHNIPKGINCNQRLMLGEKMTMSGFREKKMTWDPISKPEE